MLESELYDVVNAAVADAVWQFVYEGRKADDVLTTERLAAALDSGHISIETIGCMFAAQLVEQLGSLQPVLH